MHRDIKPANVLLDQAGRVVLTDFGLARAVAADSKVTIGAQMIGTPSYMAPEQVRGEAVGPQTDLYALGAVLYEMLTGRCPFVRDGVVATAMARLEADPEDPRSHTPLPDDVAALVMRCLQRSPDQRPESAASVAAALAEIARRPETPDTAATLFEVRPASSSRVSDPRSGSRSSLGGGSSFVTIPPEERTLAVLPFNHRGAAEHAHLAEVIAEDLVDVLTMTRGLRVTSSGATAKYRGQSVDPRTIGSELRVDAVVDGGVRVVGDRLRISARLIDVATGEQLWVDRFDGALADALDLEEITAQRIAEHLRRELALLGARHSVPQEALELYLEADRRSAATTILEENLKAGLDLLDRALEIAPDFGLALAAHADRSVRRWFLPTGQNDDTVARQAHESVARACARAPELPLTHYAAGRLAVSDGRFGDAARELTLALALAPTYADVHSYLGSLQCEAGRGDEGERHIELAGKLDPSLAVGPLLARRFALNGDLDTYREMIRRIRAKPSESRFIIESLEMRVAGWYGDLETVRRCRPSSFVPPRHPIFRYYEAQRGALLGEVTEQELLATFEPVLAGGAGPRLDAFMRQLAIEALAPMGAESAIEQLRLVTSAAAFVDADWLEHCPALRTAAFPSRVRGDGGECADAGGCHLATGVFFLGEREHILDVVSPDSGAEDGLDRSFLRGDKAMPADRRSAWGRSVPCSALGGSRIGAPLELRAQMPGNDRATPRVPADLRQLPLRQARAQPLIRRPVPYVREELLKRPVATFGPLGQPVHLVVAAGDDPAVQDVHRAPRLLAERPSATVALETEVGHRVQRDRLAPSSLFGAVDEALELIERHAFLCVVVTCAGSLLGTLKQAGVAIEPHHADCVDTDALHQVEERLELVDIRAHGDERGGDDR